VVTSRKTSKATKSTRKTTTRAQHAKCFVISPFGGWFDRYHEAVYAPAVREAGLEPIRADDLYRPSAIVHDIWEFVRNSKVMIADLTDRNPNVFYELGLAHAIGKPVILLAQDLEDVPFDLRSLRVIAYNVEDPAWAEVLRESLQKAIGEILADPKEAILAPFLIQESRKTPSVSAEEGRILALERQVNSLRAELTVRDREPRPREVMPAAEARARVNAYARSGLSAEEIVQRMMRFNVPIGWLQREVARAVHTAREGQEADDGGE
jgi:hypothetical protein